MLTVLAFVVLLGVLITVHELGHFLVAKACGVRVLTFSIGFGPRLVGFTRGDTEYRISALPLGGYVRMYGDDIHEEIPDEEKHRAFLHQPYLKKSAIAAAGPIANMILPVVLFFAMFVGTREVPAAVLGTVVPGEPAAEAGLQSGDRILAVDGAPITRYAELQAWVEPRPGVPLRLTIERDGARTEVSITPRASPSPTIFDEKRTVGRIGIIAGIELPVVVVDPGSPAAAAGIVDLDRVLSVDGAAVRNKSDLLALLDGAGDRVTLEVRTEARKEEDKEIPEAVRTVTLARAARDGGAPRAIANDRFGVTTEELEAAPLAAQIEATAQATAEARAAAERRFGLSPIDGRVGWVEEGTVAAEKGIFVGRDRIVAVDGRRLFTPNDLENALRAEPDGIHVVGIVGESGARVLSFRMMPAPQRQLGGLKVFGLALSSAFGDVETIAHRSSPTEALGRAVEETRGLFVDWFRGLGLMFSGKVGLESLGGPITIAKLSGQAAEQSGETFIRLMGLISVNLAIINLFPIPVLDGGHLLLFTIELFTRRKISAETRMKVTKVGLLLVGLLMIVAIGNDVLGLF
jgi:regulator of sigma E protease